MVINLWIKKKLCLARCFMPLQKKEAESSLDKSVNLVPSHECIQLKPRDRDTILNSGGFKPKTIFVVHNYNEKI